MSKYNLSEKKKKEVTYVTAFKPEMVEDLYEKILLKFVVEKKYRDPKYSAVQMAEEIGSNPRYISAVVNLRYHDNFSQLINEFRINEAMYLLADRNNAKVPMRDIAARTGFANRQCFYAAFFRKTGMTPREYQTEHAIEK